jgi:hypothetical protein
MFGTKTYNIEDGERKSIRVPTVINGLDMLSEDCSSLIYTTLDWKLPGD